MVSYAHASALGAASHRQVPVESPSHASKTELPTRPGALPLRSGAGSLFPKHRMSSCTARRLPSTSLIVGLAKPSAVATATANPLHLLPLRPRYQPGASSILPISSRRRRRRSSSHQPCLCVCSAALFEGEFSTAQGVAQGLFDRYRRVVEDGYKNNLKDFARAGIAAYTLGWTEEGLRREMNAHLLPEDQRRPTLPSSWPAQEEEMDSSLDALTLEEEIPSELTPRFGDSESVLVETAEAGKETSTMFASSDRVASTLAQSGEGLDCVGEAAGVPQREDQPPAATAGEILEKEIEECLLWLALVFVTLLCIPQGAGQLVVRRWSTAAPVSSDSLLQWKGFCSLIANAYYDQGMAWYSVRRLQMEQMVVMGRAEPSVLVADRMRLVFTTLEVVDPRWGGLADYPTL